MHAQRELYRHAKDSYSSQHALTQQQQQQQQQQLPLLHWRMLVVAGDPLACWPAQAGLLLQSAVLVMIQIFKLCTPSLLPHLQSTLAWYLIFTIVVITILSSIHRQVCVAQVLACQAGLS